MQRRPFAAAIVLIGWASANASEPARRATTSPSATPLRTVGRVPFSDHDAFAWIHPALCDGDGNVVLVTVPEADPRDLKNLPAMPQFTKSPGDVTVISADGKKRTVLSLSAVPELADAEQVTTMSSAVDSTGTVFALVWAARPERLGRQYIVSFDRTGRYRSHIDVDLDEMTVQRIGMFGSGEFLLKGVRSSGNPRVATMPGIGGSLQDVITSGDDRRRDRATDVTRVSDRLARAADGRIYFLPEGDHSIYAISPTGASEKVFKLPPVSRKWRPFDVKAAGNGGSDRFTMLRGGSLVRLAP
jgi:hypothetical protein